MASSDKRQDLGGKKLKKLFEGGRLAGYCYFCMSEKSEKGSNRQKKLRYGFPGL
jgi:hypothetical protein